jgi:hypothetical protein
MILDLANRYLQDSRIFGLHGATDRRLDDPRRNREGIS